MKKSSTFLLQFKPSHKYICSTQSYFTMHQKCFLNTLDFVTQNIKKAWTEELRFNKIDTFYWSIKDIFKENWNFSSFFFFCDCMEVKNPMIPSTAFGLFRLTFYFFPFLSYFLFVFFFFIMEDFLNHIF